MSDVSAPLSPGATGPLPSVAPIPEGGRRLQPRLGWLSKGLLIGALVALAILFLYPLEWLAAAAFKPRGETFDNTFLPLHWTWNYTGATLAEPAPQKLFNVAPVARWMWNSFWISGLGALLVTFASALVAFSFSYFRFPLRNFFFGVVLATLMLPSEVTMIPIYLLWNNIGHFTTRHAWLPHIGTGTQYPLWVREIFGSPFYIFLLRQFFMGIPRDYFEAARMDGDSYFSMFRRIALPLAKPALIVTFIFEFQAQWFDLINPLIYLRNQALYTAPLGMKVLLDRFNVAGGGEGDYQVVVAGTLLLVIPMILLFGVFQKYFIRGISVQGRKG